MMFNGAQHTEEARLKMSATRKEWLKTHQPPFSGKHHTKEAKLKHSIFMKDWYKNHKEDELNRIVHIKEWRRTHDNPFKGKHHTEEAKLKHSIFMREWLKTRDNPFKGKHHTEEAKLENSIFMKEWHKTHQHPMLGKLHTEEVKLKFSIFMKEWHKTRDNSFKGKHHTEEAKSKICAAIQRRIDSGVGFNGYGLTTLTSLEKQMSKILDNMQLAWKYNFHLSGRLFDFKLINYPILIEVDGAYWHSLGFNIKKDVLKTKLAADAGFKLLRVSENQLKNNVNLVEQELKNILEVSECLKEQKLSSS